MTDLRALTFPEIERLCGELGWPGYRAKQLFAWLWQQGADSFDEMTNLSKADRTRLAQDYTLGTLLPVRTLADDDGTAKFTYRLSDGVEIESVFIPDADRRTVCVSSQAGCPFGCGFCYTGTLGFKRDLAWHEIAVQVLAVRRQVHGNQSPAVTNVVFMGMGEPLLNYDAVIAAVRVINSELGLGIGARHITISTAGIPDRIREYARFPLQTRLAASLNASDDETRSAIMPINRKYPLKEVIAAVREFVAVKDKRVTFEYVMLRGINDRDQDVRQLARLLKGIMCKVNLIPVNPFPGCEYQPPPPERVEEFARQLWPLLPAITVRKSRGTKILAGCGQLAGAPAR